MRPDCLFVESTEVESQYNEKVICQTKTRSPMFLAQRWSSSHGPTVHLTNKHVPPYGSEKWNVRLRRAEASGRVTEEVGGSDVREGTGNNARERAGNRRENSRHLREGKGTKLNYYITRQLRKVTTKITRYTWLILNKQNRKKEEKNTTL